MDSRSNPSVCLSAWKETRVAVSTNNFQAMPRESLSTVNRSSLNRGMMILHQAEEMFSSPKHPGESPGQVHRYHHIVHAGQLTRGQYMAARF
jgi:hypothetical protein